MGGCGGGQGQEAAPGRKYLGVGTHGVPLDPKCKHTHHFPWLLLGASVWSVFQLGTQDQVPGRDVDRAGAPGEKGPPPHIIFMCHPRVSSSW